MNSAGDPQRYLAEADLLFDAVAVNAAIARMARQINADYANDPPIVLCVMTGAVFFTGALLPQLSFALTLDYVQATRYQGDTHGAQIDWKVRPNGIIKNRSVLILDDILDEGITLKAITDACMALEAKKISVAVLTEKNLNKDKPIQADYVGLTVPDRYVFGCGMDIYGWWRNLPAIYAANTP